MATLYAQPTKEWVIPAKPKPGRKPKRDEPAEDEEGGSDFKAKKVQNRAAQRAFRERKQSQLADLQARLTQYEQGEIERNVALQNVAKKLKEENERLKSDNEKLREEGDRVREENMLMRTRLRELQEEFSAYRRRVDPSSQLELENFISTRKRSRAESAAPLNVIVPASPSTNDSPAGKRKRTRDDKRSSTPALNTLALSFSESRRAASKAYNTLPPDYAPPPQPVFAYSPASTDTSSRSSLTISSGVSENSSGAEPLSLVSSHTGTTTHGFGSDKLDPSGFDSNTGSLEIVDCGFCSKDPDECVCREISNSLNQLIDSTSSTAPSTTTLIGDLDITSTGTITHPASITTKPSILDNLPPVQPGVPLRLRRSKQSATRMDASPIESEPIHLTPVPQLVQPRPAIELSSRPVCSGDPSNCAACADDPFGRAFCIALASGGICRDANCACCPKDDRLVQPEFTSSSEGSDSKGKNKEVPMDIDVGPGSGVGLGMGMSVETGMLLCCGDPKLCGGGGCGMRAPSSPPKAPHPQRPSLRAAGSSSISFDHPQSHTRSMLDTNMEERDGDAIRLPPFTARETQDEDTTTLVDKDATGRDIPTNEAWARLKAHPNVAFADLALLADVVARRTKCTGPRISLSPTPGEDAEPRGDMSEVDHSTEAMNQDDEQNALHPLPKLVPHAALVRCGRERLIRVQTEGVRDALAMLDVQRPAMTGE
ncbi:hypothetical protein FRC07_006106 [Ceratobasidium sp. 392]|nr:hypothetical protein FRC07_006106 [Ceratobasidium sp. 392]